MYFNILKDIIF